VLLFKRIAMSLSPSPSASDQPAIQKTVLALLLTQSIASAALLTSSTVNPIVSAQLSGQDALAGLPTALVLGGASLAAYPAGRFMGRYGRRSGLALGSVIGIAGAALSAGGVAVAAFPLFLLGLLLLGAGRGILDQGRYAAAEVNPPEHRGRAISLVVFGGTVGAVLGPILVSPAGRWAQSIGLAPLSGPYLGTAILLGMVALLLVALLPANLRDIAQRTAQRHEHSLSATESQAVPVVSPLQDAHTKEAAPSVQSLLRSGNSQVAIITMTCAQAAMVMMMAIIGLHMTHHDHGLTDVSLVISAHVLGMYLLSPVMGHLVDRLGRRTMVIASSAVIAAGCAAAPLSVDTPWIGSALFLVGLGWSGCFITGSTLLTDSLAPAQRASAQGANDTFVNIASAAGSLSSGVLLQAFGLNALSVIGLCISLTPALALLFAASPRRFSSAAR